VPKFVSKKSFGQLGFVGRWHRSFVVRFVLVCVGRFLGKKITPAFRRGLLFGCLGCGHCVIYNRMNLSNLIFFGIAEVGVIKRGEESEDISKGILWCFRL
jgi:hypothetical protein